MQISGLAQDLLSLACGVGPQDLRGVLVSLAVRATRPREGGHGLPGLFPKHWTASSVPGPRTAQCPVPGRGRPIPLCPCLQLALGQVLPRTGLSHAHCPFLPTSRPRPSPERTPSRAMGLETPVRPNRLTVVLLSSRALPRTSREVGLHVQKQPPSFLVPRVTPWRLWESSVTWLPSGYPSSAGFLGGSQGWDVTRNG